MDPDVIYKPVKKELNLVFEKIVNVSSKYDKDKKNQQVFEQLSHVLSVPGKRIRPSITLLVSNLWGESDIDKTILMATGVELLHIATLVHDDTVDHANLRRGHKTASSLWGRNAAVLIGDYIFATSAIFVCETNNVRLIKRFAETITELSRGELNEINDSWKPNISEDKYYQRIYDKTASLFCTATESGALLGKSTEKNANDLKNFGYFLGMAYQIIDDLLNVIQDNFTTLVTITPKVGVNNHKIFDALEGYRCINASDTMGDGDDESCKPEPLLNSDSTSESTTLAELKKLDACNIQ